VTMTDSCSKGVPVIEVEVFISGDWVCRILYQLFVARPFPEVLILDNGSKFAGHALDASASSVGSHGTVFNPASQFTMRCYRTRQRHVSRYVIE
jgi:hypothetical protein